MLHARTLEVQDNPSSTTSEKLAAPLVRFVGVQKTYDGVQLVVRQLDLDIRRGEFLTLLGPSGSGKTTTLMMLAGFESPTAGEILLDGKPITRTPPHKRNFGMVFQNYALFPHLTVGQNVAYPLTVRKTTKANRRRASARRSTWCGCNGMAERFPAQLSGGQQQRVALARALVFEPQLVLMDEPLGALDKQLREHMQIELKELAPPARRDLRLRHPRPERGADDVGPRRGVQRRRDPAGRRRRPHVRGAQRTASSPASSATARCCAAPCVRAVRRHDAAASC